MTPAARDDRMEIAGEQDVVAARRKGRALATELGFALPERAMITSAISELARNILDHARRGEMFLNACEAGGRRGLVVVARDHGPGIPNVEKVLQAAYAVSRFGLLGVRVLMHHVEIESAYGKGTTVTAWKWLR